MSRTGKPDLSERGQHALTQFEKHLLEEEELSAPTLRNYLSDLRQFIAWYETIWAGDADHEAGRPFSPAAVTTSAITEYRDYLHTAVQLKPATINRYIVSLHRYFTWAADAGLIQRDPAKAVKLVDVEPHAPRYLTDAEERALITAVTDHGTLRDRALIILMLHTGLRAQEVCKLAPTDVQLRDETASLRVCGKHGQCREVPLDAAARAALAEYLPALPSTSAYLFPSEKTGQALTDRALGYVVHKYADQVGLPDVSPHCLRNRFGYRMAQLVPLPQLAQLMGHDSLDTTMVYLRGAATGRPPQKPTIPD